MNDLDQIKEILFGNEKKAIDALVRRLETPESRTADVADVLPDAVTRSYTRDERLGRALSQPVENTLSDAIRREPKKFADALFPVMGPAIRKAIAEALKSTLQMINQAMETRFSPSVRYKAWRAGIPYHMWVFRQSLIYRVDEVYLVDPESGLLVSYLHHPNIEEKDEDAVSAMLTAIQDFVRDSFVKGNGGGLESVVVGEFTVWISQGPHAMLACVIRGVPPVVLKGEISAVNERVHLHHSQSLLEFNGVTGSIPGLDEDLEELLSLERHEDSGDKEKKRWLSAPVAMLAVLLLGLFTYWFVQGLILDKKMAQLENRLRSEPGVFTTDLHRQGRIVELKGLKDPLAADPMELAQDIGLRAEQIEAEFLSFQSLDPIMVMQRATQILQPPDEVSLSLRDGVMMFKGTATSTWRERASQLVLAIGGIDAVDFSELLEDDESLRHRLVEYLKPPQGVDIAVTNGVAILSGVASGVWMQRLSGVRQHIPQVVDVNSDNLINADSLEMSQIAEQLHGKKMRFIAGVELDPNQQINMAEIVRLLTRYEGLAQAAGQDVRVYIRGFTDGVGEMATNEVLSVRRASMFRNMLVAAGANPRLVVVDTGVLATSEGVNLEYRKAELVIPDKQ